MYACFTYALVLHVKYFLYIPTSIKFHVRLRMRGDSCKNDKNKETRTHM